MKNPRLVSMCLYYHFESAYIDLMDVPSLKKMELLQHSTCSSPGAKASPLGSHLLCNPVLPGWEGVSGWCQVKFPLSLIAKNPRCDSLIKTHQHLCRFKMVCLNLILLYIYRFFVTKSNGQFKTKDGQAISIVEMKRIVDRLFHPPKNALDLSLFGSKSNGQVQTNHCQAICWKGNVGKFHPLKCSLWVLLLRNEGTSTLRKNQSMYF